VTEEDNCRYIKGRFGYHHGVLKMVEGSKICHREPWTVRLEISAFLDE
jgi:hypothetical protein